MHQHQFYAKRGIEPPVQKSHKKKTKILNEYGEFVEPRIGGGERT